MQNLLPGSHSINDVNTTLHAGFTLFHDADSQPAYVPVVHRASPLQRRQFDLGRAEERVGAEEAALLEQLHLGRVPLQEALERLLLRVDGHLQRERKKHLWFVVASKVTKSRAHREILYSEESEV